MAWTNADGLIIRFGVEEAEFRNIGAYNMSGPVHWVEILVDHSELPAHDAADVTILNDKFAIPAGAFIEEVQILPPTEAFDSSNDDLIFNLGTVTQSDRSLSDDTPLGLVNAADQTELNAGGTNTAGWVGSQVGTVLTESKLLSWQTTTATATAGKTVIRVKWSIPPKNAEDTLVWNKSA